jgi:Kef-type K+ transport system membrane component KefB
MSSSSSEEPPLSPSRVTTLRVLRVLGAILSILGSLAIIAHVLKNQRYRKSPMHRLVLGLSIVDVLYSFYLAIAASFIYPVYEPSSICTVDAFFMMLGVASPLYNAGAYGQLGLN